MTAHARREQPAAGGLSCTDKGNKKKLTIFQTSSMLFLLFLCKTDGQDQQPCQHLVQTAWAGRLARDTAEARKLKEPCCSKSSGHSTVSINHAPFTEQSSLHSPQVPPSTDRQGHRVTLTYRPLRLPGLMPFLSRKPQLGLTPPQIDSVPPGPCTASLPHGQAQTQAE